MSLSARLQQIFLETPGKTQAGLARAVGARASSVSDWVSGRTKTINSAYLAKASDYLNVSPKWLATGIGPKTPTAAPMPSLVGQGGAPPLSAAISILATAISDSGYTGKKHIKAALDCLADDPSDPFNQEALERLLSKRIEPENRRKAA